MDALAQMDGAFHGENTINKDPFDEDNFVMALAELQAFFKSCNSFTYEKYKDTQLHVSLVQKQE